VVRAKSLSWFARYRVRQSEGSTAGRSAVCLLVALFVLGLVVAGLILLIVGSHGRSASVAAAIAPTGSPALLDVGPFVTHRTGRLGVDNRAAASAVQLSSGDLIQFPKGVSWDAPPGVVESLPSWIAASVAVGGTRLYLTVDTRGSQTRFAAADNRTFRVTTAGPALVFAEDANGAEHTIALTPGGDLQLDPLPVAGNLAIVYASGQQIDLTGMEPIGHIPAVRRSYPSEFVFTMCDTSPCRLSYRVGSLLAPVAGTISCGQGDEFDLDAGAFRLQFRDAGTLRNNPLWLGPPASGRGSSRTVQAGAIITPSFAHYIVSAVSQTDQPLSVAVAEDGTLYVGHTNSTATCPPCRGD
jgi:hypothetical protein